VNIEIGQYKSQSKISYCVITNALWWLRNQSYCSIFCWPCNWSV